MNIDLNFIDPYLDYIALSLLGLLMIFVKTYTQERAKRQALAATNKKLVEETESIKKEYELEIARRKYQYESKKEQYINFFKLIDKFTNEATLKSQEQMIPILDEFNRNYMAASSKGNKKGENNAVTVMSKKIQKLTLESYAELTKLKQETNTIRLIASDSILEKLDLLEKSYDTLMAVSEKMMSELAGLVMHGDESKMNVHQRTLEFAGQDTMNIKNDIIKLMRKELNEI